MELWETANDWTEGYGSTGGYIRGRVVPTLSLEYAAILDRFDWTPGSSIAVIGAAFGWSVEILLSRGFDAWGADPSSYIQETKADQSEVPDRIIDEDLMDADSAARFIEATIGAGLFDVVIVERVVTSLADGEIPSFEAAVRSIARERILVETPNLPNPRTRYNWKRIGEWERLFPGWTVVRSMNRKG